MCPAYVGVEFGCDERTVSSPVIAVSYRRNA